MEPHLFESWVIEKLVQNESMVLSVMQESEMLKEQMEATNQELKALRKSLPRQEKKKGK
jgi:hypothetical protein